MKSPIGKATALSIPIWNVEKARRLLNNWIDEPLRTPSIIKIEFEESNSLIFVTFILTVWGDARKVNEVTETICNQLRQL